MKEQVQRGDALDEALFQHFPFFGGNDARQQIKRENLLSARRIAINVERDSLAQKSDIDRLAFYFELPGRELLKQLPETRVMTPHVALRIEHFVEKSVVLVTLERPLCRLRFSHRAYFSTMLLIGLGIRAFPAAPQKSTGNSL